MSWRSVAIGCPRLGRTAAARALNLVCSLTWAIGRTADTAGPKKLVGRPRLVDGSVVPGGAWYPPLRLLWLRGHLHPLTPMTEARRPSFPPTRLDI